jgi:DNA-binding LytR/AlgR family response regulator
MRPHALIAEDEPALRAEVRQALAKLWPELVVCAEVGDGNEAVRVLEEQHPQILFLDVAMPGLDGLEVARRASGRSHVVFITAYDEHAVPAFEEGAVDFLLKPLSVERLGKTVARLRERIGETPPAILEPLLASLREMLEKRKGLRWISVLEGRELRFVTTEEILFFRSDHKYTAAVTAHAEHLVSRPLKQLVEELDPETFWQVHRSYVVNLRAILSVRKGPGGALEIVVRDHTDRIPVSQQYAHRFRHM